MKMGARGEGWLDADNCKCPILYTNRALAECERALGKSVVEVFEEAQARKLSIEELARMLAIGLEYGRRDAHDSHKPYTKDDAFNMLDEFGFARVALVVFEALAAVLQYEPAKGEAANPPE